MRVRTGCCSTHLVCQLPGHCGYGARQATAIIGRFPQAEFCDIQFPRTCCTWTVATAVTNSEQGIPALTSFASCYGILNKGPGRLGQCCHPLSSSMRSSMHSSSSSTCGNIANTAATTSDFCLDAPTSSASCQSIVYEAQCRLGQCCHPLSSSSIHSGALGQDYHRHKPRQLGAVKLEDFAQEFAAAFTK